MGDGTVTLSVGYHQGSGREGPVKGRGHLGPEIRVVTGRVLGSYRGVTE